MALASSGRTRWLWFPVALLAVSTVGNGAVPANRWYVPVAVANSIAPEIPMKSSSGAGHFFYQSLPKKGEVFKYRFTWDHHVQQALLARQPLSGLTQLSGLLSLEMIGPTPQGTVLHLSIDELTSSEMRMLGKDLVPAKHDIVGHHAYVVFDDAGGVKNIRFAPSTPSLFRNFAQNLLLLALHHRAQDTQSAQVASLGDSWTTIERSSFGMVESTYQRSHKPTRLMRKRQKYREIWGLPSDIDFSRLQQNIKSAASFYFRPDGILDRVSDTEVLLVHNENKKTLVAVALRYQMQLEQTTSQQTPSSLPDLVALEERQPWEFSIDKQVEIKNLEKRVAGLTYEKLEERLWNFAYLGKLSNETEFFWRAVGLLKLHPELTAKLVPEFLNSKNTAAGRAFIIDLLVAAAHTDAQQALVKLLSDEGTRSLLYYTGLYQRIMLLETMEASTIEMIAKYFNQMKTTSLSDKSALVNRLGSIVALGGAVGVLSRMGNQALAKNFNQELLNTLNDATDRDIREHAIMALGNTRIVANLEPILQYANSKDASTRLEVAYAIGRMDVPQTRAVLIKMLLDEEVEVAKAALRSLNHVSITKKEAQSIVATIVSGSTKQNLDAYFVSLFRHKGFSFEVAQPAMDVMLKRNEDDEQLHARLRQLDAELDNLGDFAPE